MTPQTAPYVAFFDLDETLLSKNSGRIFWDYCNKNGFYTPTENALLGISLLKYLLRFDDTEDFVRGWAKIFAGWSEDKMLAISKKFFNEAIYPIMRPAAIDEVEKHKKSGGKVVILSASTPYICNPVGEALGIDGVICTHLEVKDGKFTGNFASPYIFGEQKHLSALKYADEHGIDLKHAYYYGDAFTDRFVMEAVGNPVCVTPDRKLRAHAKTNDWRIVEW
ncbi:MAG: putative phosphatase [Turneriella sp.]|nr:putative phosphatase [Turneriella sp.]